MLVDCRSLMRNWRWKIERRMFWSRMEDDRFTIRFNVFPLHHFKRSNSELEGPAETWFQDHARNHRRLGMISDDQRQSLTMMAWHEDLMSRRSCRSRRRLRRTRLGISSGNAFVVWASTSKKYSRFFNQLPWENLLKQGPSLRKGWQLFWHNWRKSRSCVQSKQSICPAKFKGSRRNCTVLAASLDRQNCKNCNALLLRLESHQRSHQSWITKSNLIALCYTYVALLLSSTLQSLYEACLLCREARRCGRRISMRSSLSQKHSMGRFPASPCLNAWFVTTLLPSNS